MREIVLDTETTGLDPRSGHRIVEVGCIEIINRIPTGRHLHFYLNPDRDVPEEAFRVHGLSLDFLKDHPRFPDMAPQFIEFLEDSPLVIHNAEFDMRFINAELGLISHPVIPLDRAIDTVKMARRQFPGQPNNLDALCVRLGIDNSNRTLHGALLDAQLLAEVYAELTGGGKLNLEVSAGGGESMVSVKRDFRPPRAFNIPEDEAQAHTEFLEKITDPIWMDLKASA